MRNYGIQYAYRAVWTRACPLPRGPEGEVVVAVGRGVSQNGVGVRRYTTDNKHG